MGNSKNKDRNRNRPKGRKIKLKNVLNGRLGGRPRTSQPSQDITSDTDNDEAWQDITSDTDDDETWQEPAQILTRAFGRNKRSMFFMTLEVLQCILSGTICRVCKEGTIQVDITSYRIFNTHLLLLCDVCKKENFYWSGPENLNKAVLMAGKFTGIKQGQLGNFTKCLNFGFEGQNGKKWTVNVRENHAVELNRQLDISLDKMKIEDQRKILEEVNAISDKSRLKLSCDGYYPIKKNSGICVSTAMVSINGTWKVLCECFSIKEYFSIIRYFQNTVFLNVSPKYGIFKILYF